MNRDEILKIMRDCLLKEGGYDEMPYDAYDVMAREYLAVLFDSDKFPANDDDIAQLPEDISMEELISNAFRDFRHWYSR